MKIRCPRCQQKIDIPDNWAGKAIRCLGCNKNIMVPKPKDAALAVGDATVDLAELASLESATSELSAEELAEAAADTAEQDEAEALAARGVRECPHCRSTVKATDPYTEVVCSNCWKTIPPLVVGETRTGDDLYQRSLRRRHFAEQQSFYGGLGSVFAYPFGAAGSLGVAIIVAFAAIFVPVSVATALTRTVEQGDFGTDQFHEAKLTTLQVGMIVLFFIEVVFLAVVALQAVIEVARTTSTGAERVPELVWSPPDWGQTIVGVFSILLVNGGIIALVAWKVADVPLNSMSDLLRYDFATLLAPALVFTVIFFALLFPMNLIGLALGDVAAALNPVRVIKSIASTHLHYLFLFLLFATFSIMFGGLALAVISLFAPALRKLQTAVEAGNVFEVGVGLLLWGVVVGIGFYVAYVFGRILGLFARAFRSQMAFDD